MTRNNEHLRKARRVYTKYSLNERILRTVYTETYAGDIKDEICLYNNLSNCLIPSLPVDVAEWSIDVHQ